MSNIAWKNTPARKAMYMALAATAGKYHLTDSEPRLTILQLQKICSLLNEIGIINVDVDKHGAIGMQHRWCVTNQTLLLNDANFFSQLALLFVNRAASVDAGYMTKEDALSLFERNGISRDRVDGPLSALLGKMINEDEALLLLQMRYGLTLIKAV